MTINQVLLNGQVCFGAAPVTGTATATRVQISLGTLPVAGLCQWGTNQQFDLTRSSP